MAGYVRLLVFLHRRDRLPDDVVLNLFWGLGLGGFGRRRHRCWLGWNWRRRRGRRLRCSNRCRSRRLLGRRSRRRCHRSRCWSCRCLRCGRCNGSRRTRTPSSAYAHPSRLHGRCSNWSIHPEIEDHRHKPGEAKADHRGENPRNVDVLRRLRNFSRLPREKWHDQVTRERNNQAPYAFADQDADHHPAYPAAGTHRLNNLVHNVCSNCGTTGAIQERQ